MKLGKVNNLICFFYEHNSESIYTILNIKPRRVVFIIENKEEYQEDFENVKGYLTRRMPNISIDYFIVKEPFYQGIEAILKDFSSENTIINLSSGSSFIALIAYKLSLELGFKAIYGDVEREGVFILSDKGLVTFQGSEEELRINDLIASAGGKSLEESSGFYEDRKIKIMMEYIVDKYSKWKKLKQIFRNNDYVEYNEFQPLIVKVQKRGLHNYKDYLDFFETGEKLEMFNYSDSQDKLTIEFANMGYKSFVFKAGTWLEVLTYSVVKEIKGIDDAKAGVVFLWDIDKERIKNEADVLASAGSQLVYISCKDTGSYDEDDLNELQVYSNKIGGVGAVKILVSTSLPNKNTTALRAEEMGINLIIFNGDIHGLKRNLQRVIG